jgi:hypothetical protein
MRLKTKIFVLAGSVLSLLLGAVPLALAQYVGDAPPAGPAEVLGERIVRPAQVVGSEICGVPGWATGLIGLLGLALLGSWLFFFLARRRAEEDEEEEATVTA